MPSSIRKSATVNVMHRLNNRVRVLSSRSLFKGDCAPVSVFFIVILRRTRVQKRNTSSQVEKQDHIHESRQVEYGDSEERYTACYWFGLPCEGGPAGY